VIIFPYSNSKRNEHELSSHIYSSEHTRLKSKVARLGTTLCRPRLKIRFALCEENRLIGEVKEC